MKLFLLTLLAAHHCCGADSSEPSARTTSEEPAFTVTHYDHSRDGKSTFTLKNGDECVYDAKTMTVTNLSLQRVKDSKSIEEKLAAIKERVQGLAVRYAAQKATNK